jgi:hypothetical protein
MDRTSALRDMRFQGHIRVPGKEKKINPGLDTGWAHKDPKAFDAR